MSPLPGTAPGPGNPSDNGIFVSNVAIKVNEVTDGVSLTALHCERVRGDGDRNIVEEASDWLRMSGAAEDSAEQARSACNAIVNPAGLIGPGGQFCCGGRNWLHGV